MDAHCAPTHRFVNPTPLWSVPMLPFVPMPNTDRKSTLAVMGQQRTGTTENVFQEGDGCEGLSSPVTETA